MEQETETTTETTTAETLELGGLLRARHARRVDTVREVRITYPGGLTVTVSGQEYADALARIYARAIDAELGAEGYPPAEV